MDTTAVLKEAFEIQEEIARERKALRENEALLQNLLWQLEKENVGRLGDYERKRKVVSRAVIISERFRARWPEEFARLAKVTLKDAREANIPEAELMEACDSTEQVSWKIIFLGNGKVRA
jgi:hypothetical protein